VLNLNIEVTYVSVRKHQIPDLTLRCCFFGSAQQSVRARILRGFPESDEFGLGGCQTLCL
jgi:hypothetical protein